MVLLGKDVLSAYVVFTQHTKGCTWQQSLWCSCCGMTANDRANSAQCLSTLLLQSSACFAGEGHPSADPASLTDMVAWFCLPEALVLS